MVVLGLETATGQTSVAVAKAGGVVASMRVAHRHRHAEALAPAIEFVCQQAGIPLAAVELIAADIGPGLFTGLRVGIAAANAIAYARGVPTVGVSSLDALAFAARLTPKTIVAAIDALRGEVYYATYRSEGGSVTQITPPRLAAPEAVATYLATLNEECLLVGDAAVPYAGVLAAAVPLEVASGAFERPDASAIVELAIQRADRGGAEAHSHLDIVYLREAYIHPKRRDAAGS